MATILENELMSLCKDMFQHFTKESYEFATRIHELEIKMIDSSKSPAKIMTDESITLAPQKGKTIKELFIKKDSLKTEVIVKEKTETNLSDMELPE